MADLDERQKAGFTSATDQVKQVLALSTAVLTLSITFLNDVAKDASVSDLSLIHI